MPFLNCCSSAAAATRISANCSCAPSARRASSVATGFTLGPDACGGTAGAVPSIYRCVGWRETLRRFHARAGRSGAGAVVAAIGTAVGAFIAGSTRSLRGAASSVGLPQDPMRAAALAAQCPPSIAASAGGKRSVVSTRVRGAAARGGVVASMGLAVCASIAG